MSTWNANFSKKHVKRIKKINIKPGDIVVVTLKGYPSSNQVDIMREQFAAMPFMSGAHLIFCTDQILIRKGRPKSGKHKVYLNNLEYLEYLSKKGEE